MEFTAALHLKVGDEIEVKQTKSPTRGTVGLVTVDDVPIFPDSAETCHRLAVAFTNAAARFEHARPLGAPAIAARDAHDEERNDA